MQRRPSGNGWSLYSDPFTARDIGHRTSGACISRSLASGKSARWASPASTTGRSNAAPPRCCRPSTRRIFCLAHLTLKGINFFDPVDNALLHALQNPRVNIAGIRRADLLPLLDQLSPDRLSRQLRRLRDLGVIKRVAGTYRYYLTRIGRAATGALCRVTQTVIIPALA